MRDAVLGMRTVPPPEAGRVSNITNGRSPRRSRPRLRRQPGAGDERSQDPRWPSCLSGHARCDRMNTSVKCGAISSLVLAKYFVLKDMQ